MHAPRERFHIEAEFLHAHYADVSLPLEDYAEHRRAADGRGYALGVSGAISFRFTATFHLGLAVRYQHIFDRERESLDAHLVTIPLCFTWIWPIHSDAWFSFGFGIGSARVKFDPPAPVLASNTGSGGYIEHRFAFMRRLFATFDGIASVTGWVAFFNEHDVSYGLIVGMGVRFGR